MKCAGLYLTATCSKPNNDTLKCSNCGEAHPANYCGRVVAKTLQKRRNNLVQVKKIQNNQPKTITSVPVTSELSFAQAIQGRIPKSEQKSEPTVTQIFKEMMNTIKEYSERLD